MSKQLTLQEKILAPITFNKERLSIIGNTDTDTGLALGIILINSLLSGLVASINEDAGFASFAGSADNAVQFFIIAFIFQLLMLLIFAWVQGFVIRGFGGQCSTAAALRMLGFTSVWSIIGSLVGFVAPGLVGIIGLIGFLSFAFGLSALSGIGIISAIIGVIIAFILAAILVIIVVFILVVTLFFAIFG